MNEKSPADARRELERRLEEFSESGDLEVLDNGETLECIMYIAGEVLGRYHSNGEIDKDGIYVVIVVAGTISKHADLASGNLYRGLLENLLRPIYPILPPEVQKLVPGLVVSSISAKADTHRLVDMMAEGKRLVRRDNLAEIGRGIDMLESVSENLPGTDLRLLEAVAESGVGYMNVYRKTDDFHALLTALAATRYAFLSVKDAGLLAGNELFAFHHITACYLIFRKTGDDEISREAIDSCLEVLDSNIAEDVDKWDWVSDFYSTIAYDLMHTESLGSSEKVLELGRAVVSSASKRDQHLHAWRHAHYCRMVGNRVAPDWSTERRHLAESLAYIERAESEFPRDGKDVGQFLNEISIIRFWEYEHTGEREAIEKSVAAARRAVKTGPSGFPESFLYHSSLHQLSMALKTRSQLTGDTASLDESIDFARWATGILASDSLPDKRLSKDAYGFLSNLANALSLRFAKRRNLDDMKECLELRVTALSYVEEPESDRAQYTLAVANTASDLFYLGKEGRSIALNLLQDEYQKLRMEEPNRHALLCVANLCSYLVDGRNEDTDRNELTLAVEIGRRWKEFSGPSLPSDRARLLERTGVAMSRLAKLDHMGDGPLLEAIDLFKEAALARDAKPEIRLRSAWNWGETAASREDWETAFEGYSLAVDILVGLAARNLSREDVLSRLREYQEMVWEACTCAIRVGYKTRAVQLLEKGRGVILGQALDVRSDVSKLQSTDSVLFDQFEALSRELEDLRSGPRRDRNSHVGRRAEGSDRHAHLADEWESLVQQIRRLPGFESFLSMQSEAGLKKLAGDGAILVVNTSKFGSDIIAITQDSIESIALQGIDSGMLRRSVDVYLSAANNVLPIPGDPARADLRNTLSWLWTAVATPALTLLSSLADGSVPDRIWWSPAGIWNLLPLHMAGEFDDDADRSILETSTCSYIPTLKLLSKSQHSEAFSGPGEKGLVVAVSSTPNSPDLPGAKKEKQIIRSYFPNVRVVSGRRATKKRVLSSIAESSWVHFACHAHSELGDPGRSELILKAERIDSEEIASIRSQLGEFAYLGACQTAAAGSITLASEALHIASAFQMAGYRNVVAAYWNLADDVSARIVDGIYRRMAGQKAGDGNERSMALMVRDSIREARVMFPDRFESWGAIVHVGP